MRGLVTAMSMVFLVSCDSITDPENGPSTWQWESPREIPDLGSALLRYDGYSIGDIHLDGSGRIHLAFAARSGGVPFGRSNEVLYVAEEDEGWGVIEELSDPSTFVASPRLFAAAFGTGIVWYEWADTLDSRLVFRERGPMGEWSDESYVPDVDGAPANPLAALVEGGILHVVAMETGTSFIHLECTHAEECSSASREPLGFGRSYPFLAQGRLGDVRMAFIDVRLDGPGQGRNDVWTATYSGGAWGTPELVHTDPLQYSYGPILLTDGSNRRHVVWTETSGGQEWQPSRILHSAEAGDPSGWQPPQEVATAPGDILRNVQGIVDSAGRPHIFFQRVPLPDDVTGHRFFHMQYDGAEWHGPWQPAGDGSASLLGVASDQQGRVHIVFEAARPGSSTPLRVFHLRAQPD